MRSKSYRGRTVRNRPNNNCGAQAGEEAEKTNHGDFEDAYSFSTSLHRTAGTEERSSLLTKNHLNIRFGSPASSQLSSFRKQAAGWQLCQTSKYYNSAAARGYYNKYRVVGGSWWSACGGALWATPGGFTTAVWGVTRLALYYGPVSVTGQVVNGGGFPSFQLLGTVAHGPWGLPKPAYL